MGNEFYVFEGFVVLLCVFLNRLDLKRFRQVNKNHRDILTQVMSVCEKTGSMKKTFRDVIIQKHIQKLPIFLGPPMDINIFDFKGSISIELEDITMDVNISHRITTDGCDYTMIVEYYSTSEGINASYTAITIGYTCGLIELNRLRKLLYELQLDQSVLCDGLFQFIDSFRKRRGVCVSDQLINDDPTHSTIFSNFGGKSLFEIWNLFLEFAMTDN